MPSLDIIIGKISQLIIDTRLVATCPLVAVMSKWYAHTGVAVILVAVFLSAVRSVGDGLPVFP